MLSLTTFMSIYKNSDKQMGGQGGFTCRANSYLEPHKDVAQGPAVHKPRASLDTTKKPVSPGLTLHRPPLPAPSLPVAM